MVAQALVGKCAQFSQGFWERGPEGLSFQVTSWVAQGFFFWMLWFSTWSILSWDIWQYWEKNFDCHTGGAVLLVSSQRCSKYPKMCRLASLWHPSSHNPAQNVSSAKAEELCSRGAKPSQNERLRVKKQSVFPNCVMKVQWHSYSWNRMVVLKFKLLYYSKIMLSYL